MFGEKSFLKKILHQYTQNQIQVVYLIDVAILHGLQSGLVHRRTGE